MGNECKHLWQVTPPDGMAEGYWRCRFCGVTQDDPLELDPTPSMTDLPDAVVEAAARRLLDLWGWAGIDHPDTSEARRAWEQADNYARAVLAAASGPWAEQLDAANAERDELKAALDFSSRQIMKRQDERDAQRKIAEGAKAERDAALTRNAELELEVGQWKDRMWVSVRERAVWSHEAGEHAGDIPFLNCPLCESSALRAELDSLRNRVNALADEWEVRQRQCCGRDFPCTLHESRPDDVADLRALVRGSDDE